MELAASALRPVLSFCISLYGCLTISATRMPTVRRAQARTFPGRQGGWALRLPGRGSLGVFSRRSFDIHCCKSKNPLPSGLDSIASRTASNSTSIRFGINMSNVQTGHDRARVKFYRSSERSSCLGCISLSPYFPCRVAGSIPTEPITATCHRCAGKVANGVFRHPRMSATFQIRHASRALSTEGCTCGAGYQRVVHMRVWTSRLWLFEEPRKCTAREESVVVHGGGPKLCIPVFAHCVSCRAESDIKRERKYTKCKGQNSQG